MLCSTLIGEKVKVKKKGTMSPHLAEEIAESSFGTFVMTEWDVSTPQGTGMPLHYNMSTVNRIR